MTTLFTAVTGVFGPSLLRAIAEAALPARVLVRDPSRLSLPRHVQPVVADFDDPGSLRDACTGVDRLYLSSPSGPQMITRQTTMLDIAAEAGVGRVVRISALGADEPVDDVVARDHHRIEQHADASDIPQVIHLRPSMVMQNILNEITPRTRPLAITYPFAGVRHPEVDALDVADTAIALLTREDVPSRAAYDLTGPDALTYTEMAEILTAASGELIAYEPMSLDDVEARFTGVVPAYLIQHMLELSALFSNGFGTRVSDSVTEILGRPATTYGRFAAREGETIRKLIRTSR
ncbi:NAD(P)H-binding protein [Amycolatopsis sp. NPDC004378]